MQLMGRLRSSLENWLPHYSILYCNLLLVTDTWKSTTLHLLFIFLQNATMSIADIISLVEESFIAGQCSARDSLVRVWSVLLIIKACDDESFTQLVHNVILTFIQHYLDVIRTFFWRCVPPGFMVSKTLLYESDFSLKNCPFSNPI